jgi:hypothetical protein
MAHGWTGYFYAALRWCAASGSPPPPALVPRLREFAALQTPKGRSVYWRIATNHPPTSMMPSWCNGTAGRAYALLNLYKHTGMTAWLSRARHLANHATAHPSAPAPTHCGKGSSA